jgi:hypothetical protein
MKDNFLNSRIRGRKNSEIVNNGDLLLIINSGWWLVYGLDASLLTKKMA